MNVEPQDQKAATVDDDKYRIERTKIFAGVLKVLITVLIGTVGVTMINAKIQEKKIEAQARQEKSQMELLKEKAKSEERRAEIEYLGKYIEYAIERDPERRRRFAEYFATLSISEMKDNWETYRKLITNEQEKAQQIQAKIEEAQKAKNEKLVIKLRQELYNSQTKLRDLQDNNKATWSPSDVKGLDCDHFKSLSMYLPALVQPHAFGNSVAWRLQRNGIEIGGNPVETYGGEPRTVRRIWEQYGDAIKLASKTYGVPAELIIADIATESGGDPNSVREEPGYISDSESPNKVSVGLTQLLIVTARRIMKDNSISRQWLLNPKNAIMAGAAYMATQMKITQFDPPKVAAAKNVGGIYSNDGASNQWNMRMYPINSGQHADRFVRWFNEAMLVFRVEQQPPRFSFSYCIP